MKKTVIGLLSLSLVLVSSVPAYGMWARFAAATAMSRQAGQRFNGFAQSAKPYMTSRPTLVAVGTASLLVGYVAFKMLKQQYRKWMVYREYKSIEKEAQSLYRDILHLRVNLLTAQNRFTELFNRTSSFYADNKVLIDSTLKQKQKELVKALRIKINGRVQFGLIAIINLLEPILKELK